MLDKEKKTMNPEPRVAARMEDLKASEIRELLKITNRPGVISFAGGLPAPEFFPVDRLKAITGEVLDRDGRAALQYSTTEGHLPLRESIARRLNAAHGTSVTPETVLITSGSQQGLDMTGKLFLDEEDVVLCESPTYIGAIGAFRVFRPKLVGVDTDDNGMIPADLERLLDRFGDRVKLIYVVPDFQNPSGRSWSVERRRILLDAAARANVMVVEDAPYSELRYEGNPLPSLLSLDRAGMVIHLGTFSKIFCPGLRVAWLVARKSLVEKYVLIKQGTDLHSSTLAQRQVAAYLDRYNLDDDIAKLIDVYRERRDAMLAAFEEFLPRGIRYTRPAGGLFLWAELPAGLSARTLLEKCLDRNVAFVPGGSFFVDVERENTLRINFSAAPPEKIRDGAKILAEEAAKMMA